MGLPLASRLSRSTRGRPPRPWTKPDTMARPWASWPGVVSTREPLLLSRVVGPVAVKPLPTVAQPARKSAMRPARSARRVRPLHAAATTGLDPVRGVDGDTIGCSRRLRTHLEVVARAEHDVFIHVGDLAGHGLAGGIERLHQESHARRALAGGVEIGIARDDGPSAPIRARRILQA